MAGTSRSRWMEEDCAIELVEEGAQLIEMLRDAKRSQLKIDEQ